MTRAEPKVRQGRRERRPWWALTDPARNARAGEAGVPGTAWPQLRQVGRVRRQRLDVQTGDIPEEVGDAITSLGPDHADAADLLRRLRGHWGIEHTLPWGRAVTFDADRCAIRRGAAPQAVAAGRHLVIAWGRRTGQTNIAAAVRPFGGRPATAIALVAAAGSAVMN